MITDWTNDVLIGEVVQGNLRRWMESVGAAGWLISLLVDGIIGGVGAVIGFVPQIAILFLSHLHFDEVAAMFRVAFIINQYLRKLGIREKRLFPC